MQKRNFLSIFLLIFSFMLWHSAWAAKKINPSLEKIYLEELDAFYDANVDYKKFSGRVTDRDKTGQIFKVHSESKNVKFFRTGDKVEFNIARLKVDRCTGFIRGIEKDYFIIHVKEIHPCWKKDEYFRRGTILVFYSVDLEKRVKEAAKFRILLVHRRKSFLTQLNNLNHFLWSFNQQKVLLAGEYDKKIQEIVERKQKALENLLVKKEDSIRLQKELIFRLDSLDNDLDHFRIDKAELYIDRWHLDQDLGLPIINRPQIK
jgi:hypothetical protein